MPVLIQWHKESILVNKSPETCVNTSYKSSALYFESIHLSKRTWPSFCCGNDAGCEAGIVGNCCFGKKNDVILGFCCWAGCVAIIGGFWPWPWLGCSTAADDVIAGFCESSAEITTRYWWSPFGSKHRTSPEESMYSSPANAGSSGPLAGRNKHAVTPSCTIVTLFANSKW